MRSEYDTYSLGANAHYSIVFMEYSNYKGLAIAARVEVAMHTNSAMSFEEPV